MKPSRLLSFLFAVVLTPTLALAHTHTYQPGKLIGATTQDREKQGNTTEHAIFTVEVAGLDYTVRAEKVSAHAKDYTKGMIVGDPVDAAVEGDHVFLRTPKGKELKTTILKRTRPTATN